MAEKGIWNNLSKVQKWFTFIIALGGVLTLGYSLMAVPLIDHRIEVKVGNVEGLRQDITALSLSLSKTNDELLKFRLEMAELKGELKPILKKGQSEN